MITFLSDPASKLPAMNRDDAYALISTACDVNITQLVDTNMGVHVLCSKAIFSSPPRP